MAAADTAIQPEVAPFEIETWGKRDEMPKLIEALVKAQADFDPVKKTEENQAFKKDGKVSKYADLAGAIEATRPALTKNGLAVVQMTSTEPNTAVITTLLLHTSGAGLRSVLRFPVMQWNAHGVGGGLTYARRYAYLGTICAAAEDDDGNAASGKQVEKAGPREVSGGKPTSKEESNAAKLVNVCKRLNFDMGKASLLMVEKYQAKRADELSPLQLNELITTISQQSAQ